MKALIRKAGETILEGSDIQVDWDNGHPFTDPDWIGGPYTLIDEYHDDIPPEEPSE